MDDYEDLREKLIDYYGSASPLYPAALVDVDNIRRASYEELEILAERAG